MSSATFSWCQAPLECNKAMSEWHTQRGCYHTFGFTCNNQSQCYSTEQQIGWQLFETRETLWGDRRQQGRDKWQIHWETFQTAWKIACTCYRGHNLSWNRDKQLWPVRYLCYYFTNQNSSSKYRAAAWWYLGIRKREEIIFNVIQIFSAYVTPTDAIVSMSEHYWPHSSCHAKLALSLFFSR